MMPVTMADIGQSIRVARITGRDEIKVHLRDLGFVENAEIMVVAKNGGNVILQVGSGRVALDGKLASRILF